MVHRELVARVLCGMSEVDGTRIRNREATKPEIDQIETAAKELESLGVYIWDPSFARLGEIVARARLAKVKNDIQWLVLDYIGLIAGSKKSNDDARRLHIGQCSRTLKALAKELGIPIFILSQLNREADKGGPPMLSI